MIRRFIEYAVLLAVATIWVAVWLLSPCSVRWMWGDELNQMPPLDTSRKSRLKFYAGKTYSNA